MGQDYFRFKQFSVRQDLEVMRVNVDGVLLGAWAGVEGACAALDVGTGTGVIALMLAQRGVPRVDAIDISPEATEQAGRNVAHSPWPGAVGVHHSSFQLWAEVCTQPYDLVVSNPPYFSNSLKGPDARRNAMRHNDLLPHRELLEALDLCLAADGCFAGIFPTSEGALLIALAAELGLHCRRKLLVSSKPNGPVKRILCELTRGAGTGHEAQLSIYDHAGEYSRAYRDLTADFYLNF